VLAQRRNWLANTLVAGLNQTTPLNNSTLLKSVISNDKKQVKQVVVCKKS